MRAAARLIVVASIAATAWPAGPAVAEPPTLALPIACSLGRDCWINRYVDHDPTEGIRDYLCGDATYNAPPGNQHKGTDIAIRDGAAMRAGVSVLAAADGVVVGSRDGMADISVREIGIDAVRGRDCGNGLRIDHGSGWFTQYCHMRAGSVTARPGDRVTTGQRLGEVGLSGLTDFPHLHFQVSRGDEIVDPFVGVDGGAACQVGDRPLWQADVLAGLTYDPTVMFNAGFSAGAPNIDATPLRLRRPETASQRLDAGDLLGRDHADAPERGHRDDKARDQRPLRDEPANAVSFPSAGG